MKASTSFAVSLAAIACTIGPASVRADTGTIVLGPGDPLGLGPGGTVLLQVYSGGTTAGSKPTRAQTENLWYQVASGYVYGLSGITTYQITDPSINGLALLQWDDSTLPAPLTGPGAIFNGVMEDINGDVNGDLSVDGADLAILLHHYLTNPGTLPGEDGNAGSELYTTYTWLEGDINGDFSVDGADLALLLRNYLTSYNPANGGLTPVPEPASLGLLACGALALIKRRRRH